MSTTSSNEMKTPRAIKMRSEMSTRRLTARPLPELGRKTQLGLNSSSGTSINELNELKLKTTLMEQDIKHMRAKTARMRQILHDREETIKQSLSAKNEKLTLKTATDSTIYQLNCNIEQMKNALEARQAELSELKENDNLRIGDELQEELKIYYLELQRLKRQKEAVDRSEEIITDELNKLRGDIADIGKSQREIKSLQSDIDSTIDKIQSYNKSSYRIERSELCADLASNSKDLEMKEIHVREQIQALRCDIDNINTKLETIRTNDEATMSYLQSIIDEQANLLIEAAKKVERKQSGSN